MVRVVTSLCMVGALGLMVAWPFVLKNRPAPDSPLPVRRAFVSRLAVHTGGVVLLLIGAGVGSAIIVRRAREEYRLAALRNLRTLVEGKDPDEG